MFPLILNGFIKCSTLMMKHLCFKVFIDILSHWRNEDMYIVPISDHQKIEDLFENIVELVDDIENTDDEFYLFDIFIMKINTIIDTINHLKNI